MRYLVDTNIICRQDSNPKVRNWILQHLLQIAISSVTIAEIAQGIEALPPGRKRSHLEQMLSEMMRDYPIIGFDTEEALIWGGYVQAAGRPLPIFDSFIAATALAHNLQVVTENTADFPGVETVNPVAG